MYQLELAIVDDILLLPHFERSKIGITATLSLVTAGFRPRFAVTLTRCIVTRISVFCLAAAQMWIPPMRAPPVAKKRLFDINPKSYLDNSEIHATA